MIKALSAIAIAACVAAALTVLPGFTPQVEAGVPAPLAKGDRLDIHMSAATARSRPGPISKPPACAGSKILVREARLVTADRTQ
jgi:hypothetical protein